MIYISFSLYGQNPKYTRGMIQNAQIIARDMPDVCTAIYVADDVPREVVAELQQIPTVKLFPQPVAEGSAGMFWRFLAYDEPDCDVFFSRDADSRVHSRDISVMREFAASDRLLHIVRDHRYHRNRIMGGAFGLRKSDNIRSMSAVLRLWRITPAYNNDQIFLQKLIYGRFLKQSMIHDRHNTFSEEEPYRVSFKEPIRGRLFIGQVHEYDVSGSEITVYDP